MAFRFSRERRNFCTIGINIARSVPSLIDEMLAIVLDFCNAPTDVCWVAHWLSFDDGPIKPTVGIIAVCLTRESAVAAALGTMTYDDLYPFQSLGDYNGQNPSYMELVRRCGDTMDPEAAFRKLVDGLPAKAQFEFLDVTNIEAERPDAEHSVMATGRRFHISPLGEITC